MMLQILKQEFDDLKCPTGISSRTVGDCGGQRYRRGEAGTGDYGDVPGFCKATTLEDIAKHGYVLTPGHYVGATAVEDDGELFDKKMRRLTKDLEEQIGESARLDATTRENLKALGYGG